MIRLVLFAILITVIGILGYFIFLGFMDKNSLIISLLPLAIVAGLASFFSPCVFPLLPTAVITNLKPDNRRNAFVNGLIGASGVLSFLLFLGLTVGLLGQSFGVLLQNNLSLIRGVIGIFLIFLAYKQFSEKFHFGLLEKLAPKVSTNDSGYKKTYLFGFGYTLAGSGCTVPILGGLFFASLVSGGFVAGFSSFAIAGIVMAVLMFVFMVLIGYSKVSTKKVSAITPKIKKVSAVVLFMVGLFYISNALFKFI